MATSLDHQDDNHQASDHSLSLHDTDDDDNDNDDDVAEFDHDLSRSHSALANAPSPSALLVFWLLLVFLFVIDVVSVSIVVLSSRLGATVTVISMVVFVWKALTFVVGARGAWASHHNTLTLYQVLKALQLLFMYVTAVARVRYDDSTTD